MNIGVYQKSDHGGENDGSKHIAKCSIKFLQIIQRQIKLSSWALRGKKKKNKKLGKLSARPQIFLGRFLVEHNYILLAISGHASKLFTSMLLDMVHVLCK